MNREEGLIDRPSPARFFVDAAFALVAGWLLYRFSCVLVEPSLMVGGGFEVDWQKMSVDPFALPGRFPHRILAPLLAWLLGYGGEGYLTFTHGLHVLLLASTCFVVLRLRGRYLDALLVGAVIAVTAPTQMYKLHWNGYTDPICYTLFLWMIVAARHPHVFWPLFLINLTNHELAGFLLPWLFFLRRCADRRWKLDLVWIAATCGAYVVYYLVVKSSAQQLFSADYFLAHPLFPGGSFAVWNLAAVHLVTTFGPMLAVLAWHQHGRPLPGERWHLWLVLLGVVVIFCIAFDWARHSNLLMLPLVIASARFLQSGNAYRLVFAGLIGLTLFLFWLVPPWSPTAWPTNVVVEGPVEWRQEFNPTNHPAKRLMIQSGLVVPYPGAKGLNIGFGPLSSALQGWLPVVWRTLLVCHLIGVAIWIGGWLLTRLRRFAPPPPNGHLTSGS
jgi:hypothetical protein